MPDLIAPLLITLVSELAVGWLFGFRRAHDVLAIVAVNVITNPLLNYAVGTAHRAGVTFSLAALLLMELAVVLAEAGMLMVAWPAVNKRKIAVFSFSANLASFLAGVLLL